MKPLPIFKRNHNCKLCPLYKNAKTVCLPGIGPPDARLFFIGESPGEEEDIEGKPFVGKAGKLLDSIFINCNPPIKREKVYISNAIKCHPTFNHKPNADVVDTCVNTYLRQEIKTIKPDLIVVLGALSAKALLQDKTVKVVDLRRRIFYTKSPLPAGIPFIVTYHPAATFYADNLTEALVKDLEWTHELLNGKIKTKKTKKHYVKVDSIKEIEDIFHPRKSNQYVTIDLETEGLDPFKKNKKILSVQFTPKTGVGYYLDYTDDVGNDMRRIINGTGGMGFNGHFFKFDMKWMREKCDIDFFNHPINDTHGNIHLVDENFPDKSLDSVAGTYTELKGHKNEFKKYIEAYVKANKLPKEPIRKARRRLWVAAFKAIPEKVRIRYGCGDSDAAHRTKASLRPILKEKKLMPLVRLMNNATKMYTDMECNGIHVDVIRAEKLRKKYRKELGGLIERMDEHVPEGFNHSSWQQLQRLLYGRWGLRPKAIKSGKKILRFSTGKEALESLLEKRVTSAQKEYITTLLDYRKSSKLYGTYVKGLPRFIRHANLIHATWNLAGTETGRTSCTEPNLQQIPRKSDIKKMFTSRFGRDGCMLQVDISQGELRVIAHIAQVKRLIQLFDSGIDIHTAVAAEIFDKKVKHITDDQRFNAKTINFAVAYDTSAPTVARSIKNYTVEEANELIDRWNERFPEWEKYKDYLRQFVIDNHYVRNLFGRYRNLFVVDPESPEGAHKLRQAINSPIQGTLGDFNKFVGENIWRKLRRKNLHEDCLMVAEVHDSFWFDVKKSRVKTLAKIIRKEYEHADTMTEFGFKFTIPMKVDIKVGPNLLDMEELNI